MIFFHDFSGGTSLSAMEIGSTHGVSRLERSTIPAGRWMSIWNRQA